MDEQLQLPLVFGRAEQFEPVKHLSEGAARYAGRHGRKYSTEGLDTLRVDPHRGYAQFMAYRDNQSGEPSPETLRSYEALRKETIDQYKFLTSPVHEGGLGVKVTVTEEDPYESPQAMAEDVRRGQLKVLSTRSTGGHSFLTDEENDMFRAVHDAFGHASIGRDFSRHGEEAAYRAHRQMFSPAAREAMTSETRGQNSYLNFNNLGEEFPDNAVVGLPKWAQSTGKFRGRPEDIQARKESAKRAEEMKKRQLSFDF